MSLITDYIGLLKKKTDLWKIPKMEHREKKDRRKKEKKK